MSDLGNILVTGGAGYIGSHACKALADAGYVPIAKNIRGLVFAQVSAIVFLAGF